MRPPQFSARSDMGTRPLLRPHRWRGECDVVIKHREVHVGSNYGRPLKIDCLFDCCTDLRGYNAKIQDPRWRLHPCQVATTLLRARTTSCFSYPRPRMPDKQPIHTPFAKSNARLSTIRPSVIDDLD